MATILRPPVIYRPQQKRSNPQVDQQQRPIWLDPVPQFQQLTDSAPPRKAQVLSGQPLTRPLTLGINPNAVPLQLYESAPPRKLQVQVDAYPNLNLTTLVVAATIPLPLSALRLDLSAPPPKIAVRIDVYPNPVVLAPVPLVLQLEGSTQRKSPVYVDVFPNPVVLQPVPQVQRWDVSAPPLKAQVRIDTYPNLNGLTLAAAITIPLPLSALRADWPAPRVKYRNQIDQPLNRPITLNPIPKVMQWNESSPMVKYRPQVDIFPTDVLRGIPPSVDPNAIFEMVPYLIGDMQTAAETRIASIHCVASVTGTSGTVSAQDPAAFTLVLRGATISITLGGDINNPPRRKNGAVPYNSSIH